jgi:hypothetical protein
VGRGLYVVEQGAGLSPIPVSSTDPSTPRLVACWAVNKQTLPAGNLGRLLVAAHGGVRVKAILGGGRADLAGAASAEMAIAVLGVFGTPRLELDMAGLFEGRDVEFLKLWAYYIAGGGGGTPSIDAYAVLLSGDPPIAPRDDRAIVLLDSDDDYEATGVEALVAEWTVDLGRVVATAPLVRLAAIVKADPGATGTFRVRVGGTPGLVDGRVVAVLETTASAWENRREDGALANPRVPTLVKLTAEVQGGAAALIRGLAITVLET